MYLLTLHWIYFNNRCISTIFTKNYDSNILHATSTSEFSEIYMKWLYKPIADFFNWEWNSYGISKVVHLH